MSLTMEIVIGLVVLVVVVLVAEIINLINKKKVDSKIGRISFRESMDLVELPIITFTSNGKKLNFLLDTGASCSSINESALKGLVYQDTGESGRHFGIEGIYKESKYVVMNIGYKDQSYEADFQVSDLSVAFNNIKQDFGINLHGILGSTFFQKYKYVLDFDELAAYSIL